METENEESIENSAATSLVYSSNDDNDEDFDVFQPIAVKRKRVASKQQRIGKQKPLIKSFSGSELNITKDECSLYFIISYSKASIKSIVDDWIEKYEQHWEIALAYLMQFFINASGCNGRITIELFKSNDYTLIVNKMTEEFNENSAAYPIIMSGQHWKRFKINICEFVQTLIKQCQHVFIYDKCLMYHLIKLFIPLSQSNVRAFRHTITMLTMKLMTALVDVFTSVSTNLDNITNQCEIENIKMMVDDECSISALDMLLEKRQISEDNLNELKKMISWLFENVFKCRYTDICAEIRAICIIEIGLWMEKCVPYFLNDSYLVYIYRTLYDNVNDVRLHCLEVLRILCEKEEVTEKLQPFLFRCKDRIIALTRDKYILIALEAINLVIIILKNYPNLLELIDYESIFELVYGKRRSIAIHAGHFLNLHLVSKCKDTPVACLRTKRGKNCLPNTRMIRHLVHFFIESELPEHGSYLVDALIQNYPLVQDWECMTDLLIEEPSDEANQLTDAEESALIIIMVSAVLQCSTGVSPVGRGFNRKLPLSAVKLKQIKDDKRRMTAHFIQTISVLLERYIADANKLKSLLKIPQYFEVEIYMSSRQETNLKIHLNLLNNIMNRHTNHELLQTCSKTLHILSTENIPTYSNIIDEYISNYHNAIEYWHNSVGNDELHYNVDDIFNIIVSLKKLSILYKHHNLPWYLFGNLYKLIDDYHVLTADKEELPMMNEAIVYCIQSCALALRWRVLHLKGHSETVDATVNDSTCTELSECITKFLNTCYDFVKSSQHFKIQEAAYISICHFAIKLYGQLDDNENILLKQLVYTPTCEHHTILCDFIEKYVFSATVTENELYAEITIEALYTRKRFYLISFCEIIFYNIFPIRTAANIFTHYLNQAKIFGDIMKILLERTREINPINATLTILLSLIIVYKEMQNESIAPSLIKVKKPKEFYNLKELAKRFAISIGSVTTNTRNAMLKLHRTGILFAVTYKNDENCAKTSTYSATMSAPPHLLFLEILNEFTNNLLSQDKLNILNFLDRHITFVSAKHSNINTWQSLQLYRNLLLRCENNKNNVGTLSSNKRLRFNGDADNNHDDNGYSNDTETNGSDSETDDSDTETNAIDSDDGSGISTDFISLAIKE